MAVVIRMKRAGAKKRPFYRVVVANSRSPRDGRYIEQLGYYDPLTDPATFKIDADKMALWIRRGALPSESVGVMVAKHAPEALRSAPPMMAPAGAAAVVMPEDAPAPKKATRAKAAPKAKVKAVRKAKPSTKGIAKKAHTRAKAKARKASGVAKPRAIKKAKKKKS
jgi:small subunit ribosomal protein S16